MPIYYDSQQIQRIPPLEPHDVTHPRDICAQVNLEALPVHNTGTTLVVLLLANPHTLESRKTRQNTSSNPHGVLTLWWGNNLDLNRCRGQRRDLLAHTLTDSRKHGGTSRQNNVGIQILTDIDIALHDGLEGGVRNTIHLETSQVRLKEDLGTTETFVPNNNNVTIGKLETLLEGRGFRSLLHLLLEVHRDEAQGLLDIANNLTLGRGREGVTALREDFHEVVGEIASGEIETDHGVGEGVTLVNRDGVGDAVSGVEDASRGTSGGVEREYGLDVDVHGGDVEGFEHDLGHALPVRLGVLGSFREEDRVGLGSDAKLVVEGVMPDFLHIVPVGDNSVLDGVFQGEDAALGLGFISDVGVSLFHSHHDSRLSGTSNQRGED
mmetsp:Transcript_29594/g.54303  ORF Transcript_29594/g.54303 Transcript_29594/m.54303 type:complete len:380 (+) Transcript_29594:92-1231(+)